MDENILEYDIYLNINIYIYIVTICVKIGDFMNSRLSIFFHKRKWCMCISMKILSTLLLFQPLLLQ